LDRFGVNKQSFLQVLQLILSLYLKCIITPFQTWS
jgi:hypothetical protein